MNFIQISFPLKAIHTEIPMDQIELALENSGALAITFQDDADQPILEPGVGETPLWEAVLIKAIYPNETDCIKLLSKINEFFPEMDLSMIHFELVQHQAWERVWMENFKPLCFGEKFWIIPSHLSENLSNNLSDLSRPIDTKYSIILDPGLAFGTGTHPTTAMCLDYLATNDCEDKMIMDFGCGSGILALAALKLGAKKVIAIDNDPQALIATKENAEKNNLYSEKLLILNTLDLDQLNQKNPGVLPVDLLVANILAAPLINLAQSFASWVKPKGKIVLSGILKNQQASIEKAYAPYFTHLDLRTQEDWIRIDGVKK